MLSWAYFLLFSANFKIAWEQRVEGTEGSHEVSLLGTQFPVRYATKVVARSHTVRLRRADPPQTQAQSVRLFILPFLLVRVFG